MVGEDQSCPAQIKADGSTAQQPASEYAAAAVNTHGGLSSEAQRANIQNISNISYVVSTC